MSKHTPGPWACDHRKRMLDSFVVYGREDGHYLVAEVSNANGLDQNAANARLIAAAPDLLEALRSLLAVAPYHAPGAAHGVMGAEERHAIAIKAARAAIAKAEGNE